LFDNIWTEEVIMSAQLINEKSEGVYVISATPFTDHGALDLESTDRLIDFYLEKGVSGITILGVMGEAPKLTEEESIAFMDRVLRRIDGRVPTIVGVSNPSHLRLAGLAKQAMDLGAAGTMVAPIAGLKTDDDIYNYFTSVFKLLGDDIPVCFQDFPFLTGVYTSVSILNRLIDEYSQLVMLKHEQWPGLRKISQIRELAESQSRRRISILAGNGGLYLPQELRRGADGAMTGFAYPEMLVEVCRLFREGSAEEGEDLFDIYLPLVKHEYQQGIGLALRKETLKRRGIIKSAYTRKPGPQLDANDMKELVGLLNRLEMRLSERNG
jgi:4-hydroxy-tetrahydrodipicolinate synthase